MRLPLPDSCCGTARRLMAEGLSGDTLLEFCRGETVCLRGRAAEFARLKVQENDRWGPRFVPWEPFDEEKKAALARRVQAKE